jgi:hypothetical protein
MELPGPTLMSRPDVISSSRPASIHANSCARAWADDHRTKADEAVRCRLMSDAYAVANASTRPGFIAALAGEATSGGPVVLVLISLPLSAIFQNVAQFVDAAFETDANGLFLKMNIWSVDVRDGGVHLFVVLRTDAERSGSTPDM